MFSEEEIVEIILKESREIEKVLNEELLVQFAKLHNIPENQNMLSLKQEVIARKGYFLNVKKKYALYIINSEGIPVEKYDIKGLITRRSDYPQITKECVMKILDIVVKERKFSRKKLREFLEETRLMILDLHEKRSKEIAKPVTFSKEVENYKAVPSHILGMQLWNELEYEYFVPGTKGYQFKIRGIDYDKAPSHILKKENNFGIKNNNIVVPYEEEFLPEYYVMDIDSSMAYCWDDRVNELGINDLLSTKKNKPEDDLF